MNGDGPFLQSALICEKVLQEQDGVLSAIRIIDRIYFVIGPDGQLFGAAAPSRVPDHAQVRGGSGPLCNTGASRATIR